MMVEHNFVALAITIGEAPGPRDFSREYGDHLSLRSLFVRVAAAARPLMTLRCCGVRSLAQVGCVTFIVGGVSRLSSRPQKSVEPTICAPRVSTRPRNYEQPGKRAEAAVSLVPYGDASAFCGPPLISCARLGQSGGI